jgi:MFS family permease
MTLSKSTSRTTVVDVDVDEAGTSSNAARGGSGVLENIHRIASNATARFNMPNAKRYLILFIVSWNTLVLTVLSTSLLVATPEIALDLSTTPELLNVTNSAVLLAMGFSALFWSPLADIFSRRISYNAAIGFMTVTSVGTALAPDMKTFTAMRILSGCTGTYFMVAGQTIIADIFEPVRRGRATGFFQMGGVAGLGLGPCIAGIMVTYRSWRSIYWLQVAMSGLGFVLSLLLIPDIKSEVRQVHEKDIGGGRLSAWQVLAKFNPTHTFKQFLRPTVFLSDLTCGFLGVTQYGLLTCIRHIINPRFNLTTPLISGLFYIAPGVGFCVGAMAGGRLSDRTAKAWIAKREGVRLPKDRLNAGLIFFFSVLPVSMMLFGWSLDRQFGGLALPIVMSFWIGVGLMVAWNGLNTYTAGK